MDESTPFGALLHLVLAIMIVGVGISMMLYGRSGPGRYGSWLLRNGRRFLAWALRKLGDLLRNILHGLAGLIP